MPRRRYYRRYVRAAPKKKWATNMKTGSLTVNVAAGATGHAEEVLVSNSTQTASPTPVVVKTGNFKVQGDCFLTSTAAVGSTVQVILYVMYLPEVVFASSSPITTIQDHPEWIMGWKAVDLNFASSSSNGNSFSFSTRLKRNLNSGDTVALVAVIRNSGSTMNINAYMNYAVQNWTA